ncbi:MAG TPA: methyltransferase [Proteiniclasticum sp.]|nr:methyltransferase [Proteiniclasticum sp.]
MIQEIIMNQKVNFTTSDGVFSPTAIDKGTLAMLSVVEIKDDDKVLDLGCGYGVVGITIGKIIGENKVVMCDNSETAVELARENAKLNGLSAMKVIQSDGLDHVEDSDFTLILCNPPYHADFSVAKRFIEKGFTKLQIGGEMIMVTKRKEWYKNKLASTFGGVHVHEIDGYYVFVSEKRSDLKLVKLKKPVKLSKKLQRKIDKGE